MSDIAMIRFTRATCVGRPEKPSDAVATTDVAQFVDLERVAHQRKTAIEPSSDQLCRHRLRRDETAHQNIRVEYDSHRSATMIGPEGRSNFRDSVVDFLLDFIGIDIGVSLMNLTNGLAKDCRIHRLLDEAREILLAAAPRRNQLTQGVIGAA